MPLKTFVASPGLFRLLLAYLVFVNHSIPLHLGSLAVYLFFMLSGYWVYVMWGKEYAVTAAPYRNFLVSRFWRLMPVYYLALATFLVVDRLMPTDRVVFEPAGLWQAVHFYVSQLLVLGYAPLPAAAKTLPPVWSLDIELQFYLVAPLLIQAFGRSRAWRMGLFAIAALGFAAFIVFYGSIEAQSGFLPMYLAFFLVGLHCAQHGWRPSDRVAVGGLAGALLLIVLCVALPATRPLLIEGSFSGWLSDYNPDANVALAVLLAPYAMATVRKPPSARSWLARLDRDLSNLTYEIYLLHESALLVVAYLVGSLSKYQQLPVIVLAWIGLLPVAWLVYQVVDRPIDRLRSAYVKARRQPSATFTLQPSAAQG
jgi:peptidoglycan/LPS O-acetylase OafA/YrhL